MKTLTLENGTTIKVTDEQLQELIELQPKEVKSSIGWTPEIGENYYYIRFDDVACHKFLYTNHNNDKRIISAGNIYKTESEAQRVLDKQKALRRIHEYMYKNDLVYVPDWNDRINLKWTISGWHYNNNEPTRNNWSNINDSKGNLVFKTREDLIQVIDNCKEDLEIYLKD
jgi:hypothetical protein